MRKLLSCQPVRLKAFLSWDFQRSSCHAPGIPQTWHKKWTDKPASTFREGTSAEPGFCSRPVWVSAYGGKSSKRSQWIFRWIFRWIFFCGGFFGRKMQKENPPKKIPAENPPAENKKSAGARPSRNPPDRPKNPPQNLPTNPPQSNLQVHAGVFGLRRLALGGVFKAWILGHSLAAFWAWSRLPC